MSPCPRIINTLLGHMARADPHKVQVGRSSVFSNVGRVEEIGGGKSLWVGTFSSFRPAWKLFLNVDMANKPAYEENSVMGFCLKVLEGKLRRGERPRQDLRGLSRQEESLLSKELKGLKIRWVIC